MLLLRKEGGTCVTRALEFPGGLPRNAFRSRAVVVQIWPDRLPWGGEGITSCGRKYRREAVGANFFSGSNSKSEEKRTTFRD